MTNIIDNMLSLCPVSEDTIQELKKCMILCRFPKKYQLIKENTFCKSAYFIEKGMTRSFWLVNGEEITTSFSWEGGIVFSMDEVMHFKTSFSFDGITGLPVQQILRDTVAGASESQAFMNNLYESGLTAKATLEYTGELNEKAKTALVKSFEEFGSGAKNTGKILPVPLGMKLTPLDIKLTDSQFFELKKYNALQIAGAFGVKPNQINDYSKSSYSNSEMQQLSFYVDTELFIIKQYEEEINFKMLPDEDADDGYYYKFNEKVLFRTDSKTQMEYLRNGVGGMIIKPNEARRKLDMEDTEGGDVLLANGSIVPLTMAGAAYLKGESEQENADEPEQPEEETEPDTEQPDTATEPDETDEAEDEDEQEGGE